MGESNKMNDQPVHDQPIHDQPMDDQPMHDQQGTALILWLVWGSILFSLAIFATMPFVIPAPQGYQPPEIAAGNPPKILAILALATAVLIPLLTRTRKRMFFEPVGERCRPGTPEARGAYFTMSLTTWVMCEVVGIFGFALYFLTYRAAFALPFIILAAILTVSFRPRPRQAEQAPEPKDPDQADQAE
jgi:hypothetical protein